MCDCVKTATECYNWYFVCVLVLLVTSTIVYVIVNQYIIPAIFQAIFLNLSKEI